MVTKYDVEIIRENAKNELLNNIENVCGDCGYGCPDNCEDCPLSWIVDDLKYDSKASKNNEMRKRFIERRKEYGINELGEDWSEYDFD